MPSLKFSILHSSFCLLNRRFLPRPFGARRDFVLASFVFALPLPDLLLDLLFHQVDRGVKVAFAIFREQVRAAHAKANRAAELPFRNPHVIVFQRDARVQNARIQAIQLFELCEHMFLNGIRQRYVVRGEDQLHKDKMQSANSIFNRQFPAQKFNDGSRYGGTDKHG